MNDFLLKKIIPMAKIDAPVLILGETGTGKKRLARMIHDHSTRAALPFVLVDCASIPAVSFSEKMKGLKDVEFPESTTDDRGYFAEANGGTLFFNEIHRMPEQSQEILLRFLQEKKYKPVDSNAYIQADVRVIAASSVDLLTLSDQVNFRRDLLHLLNIHSLSIPPLRDRKNDISVLTEHFLNRIAEKTGVSKKYLSVEAMNKLLAYHWPENIRELEDVIQRSVVSCPGPVIEADYLHLSEEQHDGKDSGYTFQELKAILIARFEKEYISRLLTDNRGNVSKSAHIAQIDRRYFYRLMKKYQISRKSMLRKDDEKNNDFDYEDFWLEGKSLAASKPLLASGEVYQAEDSKMADDVFDLNEISFEELIDEDCINITSHYHDVDSI